MIDAHSPGAVALNAAAQIGSSRYHNGAPGLCRDYSPSCYAAFVLDPDGHNIEAVVL